MKKYKNLYIAATSQHVGKTTSTLGLVAAFQSQGIKVGYSKPVGQKHIDADGNRVDKDSILFADLLKFSIDPALHSPIIFSQGETKRFIDENMDNSIFNNRIIHAEKSLSEEYELTVYEGTGHPGVGSIGEVSNADVAKLIDASVIMIVEGGIGKTIDMMNMCLSFFNEKKVPILGVIINKVRPDKLDVVKHYVGKWLEKKQIPLLGILPYDPVLAYPILWSVSKAISGEFIMNIERGFQRVEKIVAGSSIIIEDLKKSTKILLVVSSRVLDEAIKKIENFMQQENMEECPLNGIVVTAFSKLSEKSNAFIQKYNIPLISSDLDTYGVVIKISQMEVKINRRTPWKISKAIDMVKQNIDTNLILSLT